MKFEFIENTQNDSTPDAVIKVIGVGGGGGNALEHMVTSNIGGVDFICLNTDAQALRQSSANTKLQLGTDITKGLGAGGKPDVGRQAALEDRERIVEELEGADMVFIAAGMGGGTGTGAAPVIAQIAKDIGILTVAVVTKPFLFENRMEVAEGGLTELRQHVDSLITIPNEKLLSVLGEDITLLDAFKAADSVLLGAVQGIVDLITEAGKINGDFNDVRTVMSEMGMAMIGTGQASGENRAIKAAESAVSSPLLEGADLSGARGLLINITGGLDIKVSEFNAVGTTVKKSAAENVRVFVSTVIDAAMTDEIKVTVIATGLGAENIVQSLPATEEKEALLRNDKKEKSSDDESVIIHKRADEIQQAVGDDVDYYDIPAFLRNQAD